MQGKKKGGNKNSCSTVVSRPIYSLIIQCQRRHTFLCRISHPAEHALHCLAAYQVKGDQNKMPTKALHTQKTGTRPFQIPFWFPSSHTFTLLQIDLHISFVIRLTLFGLIFKISKQKATVISCRARILSTSKVELTQIKWGVCSNLF